jgi:hypothetical protein
MVITRASNRIIKPSRYLQVTKVSWEDWKLNASDRTIMAELKLLFEELKVLRCLKRAEIKAGTKD